MAREASQFRKGHPKLGGRKPGTPNKVPASLKALMHKIVAEHPDAVEAAMRTKLLSGDTAMTTLFSHYLDGKPPETVQVRTPQPIHFIRRCDRPHTDRHTGVTVAARTPRGTHDLGVAQK
jgi:hypothetical protein